MIEIDVNSSTIQREVEVNEFETQEAFCTNGTLQNLLGSSVERIIFVTDRDSYNRTPRILLDTPGKPKIEWYFSEYTHSTSAQELKKEFEASSDKRSTLFIGYLPRSWFSGTFRDFCELQFLPEATLLVPVVCNCNKHIKMKAIQPLLNNGVFAAAVMDENCSGEVLLESIYHATLELLNVDPKSHGPHTV